MTAHTANVFGVENDSLQADHPGGHTLAVPEDHRTGDQHGGPGSNDHWCRRGVDATVHLYLTPGLQSFDQLADPCDLRHGRPDELLSPKPGLTVLNGCLERARE
jgi:hypothetical protein